ncbi:MAG: flagellar type III secretion system pore protein FliP [Firmicutes bacterium]|jgi:flagellar biosynthetic protein FliP|nr:flagellar type III secretion system pore protein FliP [Bacillota bacterium]
MRSKKRKNSNQLIKGVYIFRYLPILLAVLFLVFSHAAVVYAQPPSEPGIGSGLESILSIPLPRLEIGIRDVENRQDIPLAFQIITLLTILALAPAILIMLTSFTRIVIVLSFIRSALGSQNVPPNQAIIGLALFLTFFVMAPAIGNINEQALQPYLAGEITQVEAGELAWEPIRDFMLKQTREKDLALFVSLSKSERPSAPQDVQAVTLMPAFAISELKTAFQIGFLIYVPFLIIDMVVASTLMSMGMMMLPPVMISLPFKILLFIMVDGWNLVIGSLVRSFG